MLRALVSANERHAFPGYRGLSLLELCSLRSVCCAWRAALQLDPSTCGDKAFRNHVARVFPGTVEVKDWRHLDALAQHGHTAERISVVDRSGCQVRQSVLRETGNPG